MTDSNDSPELSAPYLTGLNAPQREAVMTVDGPVLVLSGAGTGKTRVLTTRLVHILSTHRAWPSQILAVTFTNKAAAEMKGRISAILGRPVEGWWLGTFHALAARILRGHAERVGLKPNFSILDTDDQLRLVKQLIQAENLDSQKWPSRVVLGIIERWKDRGLTPERVTRAEQAEVASGRILDIYRDYQARLATLNACDFGDLLLHNIELFQKAPEVLQKYQEQFKYILVDEYQDTNVAQYLWLRLLAQGHRNLCVVGDDDQSVYGWRGAEVENILKFEQDFPGAKVVRLEQNYRSTPHILAAASGLIAKNAGRLGKTLWTERAEGEKVRVTSAWDGEEEARQIGDEIEALQRKGHSLREVAILVRAGFQTREFEERFITLGIPYRVIGGPRFYERLEIRDALAYLRLVNQPDDALAFERIVNTPRRGLGDSTVRRLHDLSRAQTISLPEAARRIVETDELKPAARRALAGLMQDLARWRGLAETTDHAALAEIVLDESGYTDMWKQDKSIEAPGRLENLKELIHAIEEFENLGGFLEHVSLVMENVEAGDRDQLTIMTLHGAKGLEFDVVFLPGWEEGLFPSQRTLDENGLKGLEEERRLAYVGLTRARKIAYLSHAANRRVHNQWQNALPSRFLAELPADNIERRDDQTFHRGQSRMFNPGFSDGRWSGASYMQRTARKPPPTIDATAVVAAESPGRYARGAKVFHQKFGYGAVVSAEGDKLEIEFDKAGRKKVMAGFVVPAHQAGVKLRDFSKIFDLAAARKGGAANLKRMLAETKPRPPRVIAKLTDDRVLAAMTRAVFAGGFGWHIIDRKWPAFEVAFKGFDPHAAAFLNEEQLDALMGDRSIIRSPRKIMGVPRNARFVLDLAAEHGSAARFFASWPDTTFVELNAIIRKRGTGFGFENAARFLRGIGKPAFIAAPDVVAALVREGVLERPSSGKKALQKMQAALNAWSAESGHDLTTLSRVLAMSTGPMDADAAPRRQRGYLSRM